MLLLFPFSNAWEQRKLNEVCSAFEYGLNAAATTYDGINKYLRITDIDDGSHRFKYDNLTSPGTDLSVANSYRLSMGDILFARTGASVGKTYLYRDFDGLVYFAGFLIRAKIKPEYDAEFIFQNTTTDEYDRFIRITSQRSGQPGVNAHEYGEYQIFAPSLLEQQQIGTYFRNLDRLITLHQRKVMLLKQLKQAYLQQMFPTNDEKVPRLRFANFSEEWKQRKFPEVYTCLRNNTLSRAELNYEYGEAMNIHYGDVLVKFGECLDTRNDRLPYVSNASVVDKYNKAFLNNGDIVIADTAEDNSAGKCCELLNIYDERILSGLHTIPCRPNWTFSTGYLGYYMNSPSYRIQLRTLMQGIKVTSVSKAALQFTKITYPQEVAEQSSISNLFRILDNTIALCQKKHDNLKLIKTAYLKSMFI